MLVHPCVCRLAQGKLLVVYFKILVCDKMMFPLSSASDSLFLTHSYQLALEEIVLIQLKEEGWTWFSKGRQGCSEGNPKEQACQPEKNPIHPDHFTAIYILFEIFG